MTTVRPASTLPCATPSRSGPRRCSAAPGRSARGISCSRVAATVMPTSRSSRSSRIRPRRASCAGSSPSTAGVWIAKRSSTSSPDRRPVGSSWPSRRRVSSGSAHLRRGGSRRRRPDAAEFGAASGSSGRARPAGRRHPDHRRLAARDVPGRRGDGWRDRRMCRFWSIGWRRTTLTSPTTGRVYPVRSLWEIDLPTYEPGTATCPRCADGTPSMCRAAPGGLDRRHAAAH